MRLTIRCELSRETDRRAIEKLIFSSLRRTRDFLRSDRKGGSHSSFRQKRGFTFFVPTDLRVHYILGVPTGREFRRSACAPMRTQLLKSDL